MTLPEVMVAIAVLATALAGLAPVMLQCTRLLVDAKVETRAVALAAARLEQLGALPYEQEASTGMLVTDEATDLSSGSLPTGGTGLRPGDPSAAWVDTPRASDALDDEGAVVGASGHERAVYVRRWAVSALPAPMGVDRVLVQVFARDRAREAREAPRSSPERRPGDVWLFTVRARVLR